MFMYICEHCQKSFQSIYALSGHKKIHKSTYDQHKLNNANSSRLTHNTKQQIRIDQYNKNPSICQECNCLLPYTQRHNKFCSSSCAASYNNKKRKKKPKRPASKPISRKSTTTTIWGPYSKVYTRTCAHCQEKFISRSPVKYCDKHSHLYKNNNRNRYAFTFSLKDYPDLFSKYSADLKQYGMWSYSNTTGLTRDHRVSVNEAILNNYDPYYIKHPLNCELIPWLENNKKKTKSSISYEELVRLVDAYDKNARLSAEDSNLAPQCESLD